MPSAGADEAAPTPFGSHTIVARPVVTRPYSSFGGVKSAMNSCAGIRPSRDEVYITVL